MAEGSFGSLWSSQFTSAVRKRGEDYYNRNKVTLTDWDTNFVLAVVRGHSGRYTVEFRENELDEESITVSCSCPYFEDHSSCKHVWATILTVDDGIETGDVCFGQEEADDDDEWFDDWSEGDDLSEAVAGALQTLNKSKHKPSIARTASASSARCSPTG